MTDSFAASSPPMSQPQRIVFALRQAALLGVALLVASAVTNRLLPAGASARGLVSTPYLWAIVLWTSVLIFHAVAFAEDQTRLFGKWPFYAGLIIGGVIFVSGLVFFDQGAFLRRVLYLFAASVGAVMFWWAALSLVELVVRRITASSSTVSSSTVSSSQSTTSSASTSASAP